MDPRRDELREVGREPSAKISAGCTISSLKVGTAHGTAMGKAGGAKVEGEVGEIGREEDEEICCSDGREAAYNAVCKERKIFSLEGRENYY